MSITEILLDAKQAGALTRVKFRGEWCDVHGYVLDVGPAFFLLGVVSDGNWFDGYRCARFDVVDQVGPDPYQDFVETVLKLRGETMPSTPPISLRNLQELLASASRAFPLISVRTVDSSAYSCWIGQVRGIDSTHLTLLEINPGSDWDQEPKSYELSRITRIEFGDDYAEALWLVGGKFIPPAAKEQ